MVAARALNLGSQEVWQQSFSARLEKWLKREGYSGIDDHTLLHILKTIKSASQ